MISLTVYLSCLLVTCAASALAAVSDFRGLTIPNIYSGLIAGSYLICILVLTALGHGALLPPLFSSVLAALIFFAITFVMFAAKILGAADSKLGTACVLWMGLSGFVAFLFYMTVFGGVLALISIVLRKWKPIKNPPAGSWLEKAQAGENKVPYGIAIFLGMLVSFVNLGYFNLNSFASFFPG